MATNIIMPQGGQDLTEGMIVRWVKQEGDAVRKDDIVCEVETEKAVFEVPAPCDGVLLKIMTPAGDVAHVFSAIGVIGHPGEQLEPVKAVEKPAQQPQAETKIDIEAIRKRLVNAAEPQKTRIRATGRAKRVAREHGVDLAGVRGTGPGGRIIEKDVRASLQQHDEVLAEQSAVQTPPEVSPPASGIPRTLQGRREELPKMRKVIARRLQLSKQTIPHFYVTVTVEMADALALRAELNAAAASDAPAKISVNAMIVKAAALALEDYSLVNCILQGETLTYLDQINIGIAVSLDEGLVVPVLEDVDVLSLRGIAKKTTQLVALAKSGKQPEFCQAAFTISNMGMLDVENFAAIINPPESAILAVGSIHKGVVVSDKNDLSIRDLMKMTLSADHRVIDGALAAKFLNSIKYHLQHPQTLLA